MNYFRRAFASRRILILLVMTVFGTIFSYNRLYRQNVELTNVLFDTYGAQWRVSQIREQVLEVESNILLSQATGTRHPELIKNVNSLKVNLMVLLSLELLPHVLEEGDIHALEGAHKALGDRIIPEIMSADGDKIEIADITHVKQVVFDVLADVLSHEAAISTERKAHQVAERNRLVFWGVLSVLFILGSFLHNRMHFEMKKVRHIKHVASLFTHATRTHVFALNLFFTRSYEEGEFDAASTALARETCTQLAMNYEGMQKFIYSGSSLIRSPLHQIVETALKNQSPERCSFTLEGKARTARVPDQLFTLLLSELVMNAVCATEGVAQREIVISAEVKRLLFLNGVLELRVRDNGIGMDKETLGNATRPFFTTRENEHSGLGLTSCEALLISMRGSLDVRSAKGDGTTVIIRYPLWESAYAGLRRRLVSLFCGPQSSS